MPWLARKSAFASVPRSRSGYQVTRHLGWCRGRIAALLALVPADDHLTSSCPALQPRRAAEGGTGWSVALSGRQDGHILKTLGSAMRIAQDGNNSGVSCTSRFGNVDDADVADAVYECRSHAGSFW